MNEPQTAEQRHQARLALLRAPETPYTSQLAREQREGREGQLPPAPPAPQRPRQLTEREERLAAGLVFADRDDRIAERRAEASARRRRADTELAGRDSIYRSLRNREGSDYADQWMDGGDAA
ncbi:hypothetical protein [Streptomyces sp. WAC01280]|uniref:hypothetical protein n=1 Tax=Streptomyces sp. WAC01280 TaxID=2487424 RepID=UPI000F786EE3|nr:hypothetical protein [Streptomyces sp. WAC01280]RSS50059.1 hypothetical protein EF909_39300 [Streptomyces sp. WAC01280]